MRNKRSVRASIERVSVRPSAEKGLSLEATVSPSLDRMVGDQRRFEQVLYNLLGNHQVHRPGRVTVIAEVFEAHSRGRRQPGSGGPRPGVGHRSASPEDMTTIFQPFRQVDTGLARVHEGTGLGLAICVKLAALLGGEITATSEWSKGSTFTVTLGLRRRHDANGPPHRRQRTESLSDDLSAGAPRLPRRVRRMARRAWRSPAAPPTSSSSTSSYPAWTVTPSRSSSSIESL